MGASWIRLSISVTAGPSGIEGHTVHVCGLGILPPQSGHRSENEGRCRLDALDLADSVGHRLPIVHPYASALLKDQHMGRGLQDLSYKVFLHPRHHADHDHEGADAYRNAAQRNPGDERKEAAAALGRQVTPGDVPLQASTRRDEGRASGFSERGEEDHVANRRLIREEHGQPIDPHAQTSGRRHAVFERPHVVFIDRMCLVVTGFLEAGLLIEAPPLVDGIIQLREGIGNFHARHEKLESLSKVGVVAMRLRERTELPGVVHHKGGLDQLRLNQLPRKVCR